MKFIDIVRRAGRSLRQAKARTLLTSLAIAVGAFTLTLSIAAGTGTRQYADRLIQSNVNPQSLFVAADGQLFGEGGGAPGAGGGLREYSEGAARLGNTSLETLSNEQLDAIRALDDVSSVVPTYMVSIQYATFEGSETRYTTDVMAYDTNVLSEIAAGDLPDLGQQIADNEMVIPEAYAKVLDKKPEELIGQTVTVRLAKPVGEVDQEQVQEILATEGPAGIERLLQTETRDETFTIRAVSAESATSFTSSSALFINDVAAEELSSFMSEGTDQFQRYITATVVANDGVDPENVKAQIEELGVIARTANDLQELLFTIVNVLQGIVAGFGVLALIASVFGIINTQYISVLERTREIGLMKALGMRGRHVSRLFQLEAAWIGLLGGLIGAVAGWLFGVAINPWLSETVGIGENRLLVFELIPIVVLVFGLSLIAMLAGWFPARKAAKLDPIEALRTE